MIMKLIGVALYVALIPSLFAQSTADETALRAIPRTFCAAWAAHDGHKLAELASDDVDFVNVGAVWLRGKRDFEKYHTRLLSGRFKDSSFSELQTFVRLLRPDLAIVRWSWKIQGDKNFDGTLRPVRYGLFSMLVEKKAGKWLIISSQNTNHMSGPAPEEKGIEPGIVFPDEKPTK
jgi:uncharacterized protein (TIGR02246 family)